MGLLKTTQLSNCKAIYLARIFGFIHVFDIFVKVITALQFSGFSLVTQNQEFLELYTAF